MHKKSKKRVNFDTELKIIRIFALENECVVRQHLGNERTCCSRLVLTLTPKYISNMAQVEYITIKNASRKVLNKMREIGEEKAQRLQEIQERWDAGDIKDVEVVQL